MIFQWLQSCIHVKFRSRWPWVPFRRICCHLQKHRWIYFGFEVSEINWMSIARHCFGYYRFHLEIFIEKSRQFVSGDTVISKLLYLLSIIMSIIESEIDIRIVCIVQSLCVNLRNLFHTKLYSIARNRVQFLPIVWDTGQLAFAFFSYSIHRYVYIVLYSARLEISIHIYNEVDLYTRSIVQQLNWMRAFCKYKYE